MNSRQTSNIKHRLLIAGAVFLLAALFWRFFPTPIQALGETFFGPLLSAESALYDIFHNGGGAYDLALEEEVRYLQTENASLRQRLGSEDERRIAAGVIGRPAALPYDVLVIDRGEEDGVIKDAPVYAGEYHVIGFVAAVYRHSSVVALVTTPGFTSTVFVYGPNIYTTAEGQGGGVIRIHVPQGINLNAGDMVVMPSLSPGIYGTITAVDSVPSRPEQYGYVTSDTPIGSLRHVAVGTRPLSPISFEEAREAVDAARRELLSVPVPEGILIEVDSGAATSTDDAADARPTGADESEEASSI